MSEIKISIVTSCYNCGPYLHETCDSILSQNYKNWEWILIDDFSEDNTQEIISEVVKRDGRIRSLKAEFKKQYWWNPQIAATGDVFAHLDSDDRILPNTLKHINYYFGKFPDLYFLHFYANKFSDNLPKNKDEFINNFVENVYISTDNDSFLEGFEKLTPFRTDIFGCLRVIKNDSRLKFPVHEDGEACSSNDGQWCLVAEEYGKWMTIPRTTYLIRRRVGSEQFTKWNIRGEVKLIEDARERRKNLILERPRNIKYFDDIFELAESVYTNKLNYETENKNISFLNFNLSDEQKVKSKILFHEHTLHFDKYSGSEYYILNMDIQNEPEDIMKLISKIKNTSNVTVFCSNTHLMHNNKTNKDYLQTLCQMLTAEGYHHFFNIQKNRFFASFDKTVNVENVIEHQIETKTDNIKPKEIKNNYNFLHVEPENTNNSKNKIIEELMMAESRAGNDVILKKYYDITQTDLEKYDVIINHDSFLNDKLQQMYIPFMNFVHEHDELHEDLLSKSLLNVSSKRTDNTKNDFHHLSIGTYKEVYYNKSERNTVFRFPNTPKLICVERNLSKSSAHLSLLVAREMHLPVIIVTPEADENSSQYKSLIEILGNFDTEHDTVSHLREVTDNQLNDLYNENHFFINLNDNYLTSDTLNAMSTGMVCLSVTGEKSIPGLLSIEKTKNSIIENIRKILKDNSYELISGIANDFTLDKTWDKCYEINKRLYDEFVSLRNNVPVTMKDRLEDTYENVVEKTEQPEHYEQKIDVCLEINLKEGNPIATLICQDGEEYNVVFKNKNTGEIKFSTQLRNNHWAAVSEKYFIPWLIYVERIENGEIIFEYDLTEEITSRKTHVYFDSKSIGDNVAWVSAVDEFRKTYNVKHVTCATFFNDLFEKEYLDIKFIEPNTGFDDFEIQYRIPWLEEGQFNPIDCKNTSLQNVCASILGVEGMKEVPTKITVKEKETELKTPYVAIGMQSTAQAKYWNNPGGWEKLTDYIKSKGYGVVFVDKHEHFGKEPHMNSNPSNAIKRNERTLDQTIATIAGSEFFIGIGSGLSWISWALNKEVILISGFSQPFSEFQNKCTRIINTDVCHGCYNRVKLDPSNWTWCPDHEGTDRMFECTKNISVESVCDAVDNVIQELTNE
tara:strand:+ start:17978 stop:21367 length:3390 start_codon:yes stop_codon:yes gene_type:complete